MSPIRIWYISSFLTALWYVFCFSFCSGYQAAQNQIWSLVTSAMLIWLLVCLFSPPRPVGFRTSPLISFSLRVDFILSYYRLSTSWGWNHDCWQLLALIFLALSTRRRGCLEESWEGLWLACLGSCTHHPCGWSGEGTMNDNPH